jgi:hypothetical protein
MYNSNGCDNCSIDHKLNQQRSNEYLSIMD